MWIQGLYGVDSWEKPDIKKYRATVPLRKNTSLIVKKLSRRQANSSGTINEEKDESDDLPVQ